MPQQVLRRRMALVLTLVLAVLAACTNLSVPGTGDAPAATPVGPPPVPTPSPLPADVLGMRWRFAGLAGQSLRVVGGSGQAGAAVYAGGNGLAQSTDNGATWAPLALPAGTRVDDIQVSRADPRVIYAGASTPCRGDGPGGQFRSTDGGATWTPLAEAPASLAVDGQDAQVLLGMSCRGVVRSADGGRHWTLRPDAALTSAADLRGARVRVPANPIGPIYATWLRADGSGRIRTSYNGGADWGGDATFSPGLTDLLVDDKRPQFAWALSQAGVVRTTDNGTTWAVTTTGLDAAHIIRAGALGPYQLAALAAQYSGAGDMDELYAGTYATPDRPAAGAFSSGDLGRVWGRFGGTLGGRDIRSIHVAREPAADGAPVPVVLYAATDGGVYKIVLGTSR